MVQNSTNPESVGGRSPDSLDNIIWGVIIIAVLIGIFVLAYRASRGINPAEYEGRIVDKWAGYTHSDEGSFPYFRLLLETESGRRLTVAVDQVTYHRSKIGMWIKKTRKGIELTRIAVPKAFAITKVA